MKGNKGGVVKAVWKKFKQKQIFCPDGFPKLLKNNQICFKTLGLVAENYKLHSQIHII